jgi:3-dehydroquinate dehydratase
MFTPQDFINNIQQAKRNAVNILVQPENLRNEMLALIDAQTKFYHGSLQISLSIANTLFQNFTPKK